MGILLMRLFYAVYFLGLWVCIYHILSRVFYDKTSIKEMVSVETILLVLLWPLAFFSRSGRERLKKISKKV